MYLTIYRFIYGARAHMVGRSVGRSDAWLRAHFRQNYILEADGQKAETFHTESTILITPAPGQKFTRPMSRVIY